MIKDDKTLARHLCDLDILEIGTTYCDVGLCVYKPFIEEQICEVLEYQGDGMYLCSILSCGPSTTSEEVEKLHVREILNRFPLTEESRGERMQLMNKYLEHYAGGKPVADLSAGESGGAV